MPVYIYQCPECGKVQEVLMGMTDPHPETTDCQCGKSVARRSIRMEQAGRHCLSGNWPKTSLAMAVHPSQRGEAAANAAAVGVPTEFNERGEPTFSGQHHQNEYMKAFGYRDLDAGYGQYSGGNHVTVSRNEPLYDGE